MITHRGPENYDPITWVGRLPVYATTIIVALYVVSMIGVAVALASGAEAGLSKLTFDTASVLRHGEIWRCLTYAFVNPPDPWFIISLVMLYIFGRDVEQYLGGKGFVRLYLGFLLLGPSLLLAASLVTAQTFALAQSYANFAVFLAFAALCPTTKVLMRVSAWRLAWVITVGITLYLMLHGRLPDLYALLTTASFAWYACRHRIPNDIELIQRLLPLSHRTKTPKVRILQKDALNECTDPYRIIDPLLDKISQYGLTSLTRLELEQLENARRVLLASDSIRSKAQPSVLSYSEQSD